MLEFEPGHYLQTAGLAAFYDDQHWFYLHITHDETLGRVLRLLVNEQYQLREAVPLFLTGLTTRVWTTDL